MMKAANEMSTKPAPAVKPGDLAVVVGAGVSGVAAAKLLHGALAALLTALLFRLSPAALTAFAPVQAAPPLFRPLSAALLAAAALFPIWGRKKAKDKV